MICEYCNKEFPEKEIQESHDVPRWLFLGTPNERKAQADKFPRRWLCKDCHDKYDLWLRKELQEITIKLSGEYNDRIKRGKTNIRTSQNQSC